MKSCILWKISTGPFFVWALGVLKREGEGGGGGRGWALLYKDANFLVSQHNKHTET